MASQELRAVLWVCLAVGCGGSKGESEEGSSGGGAESTASGGASETSGTSDTPTTEGGESTTGSSESATGTSVTSSGPGETGSSDGGETTAGTTGAPVDPPGSLEDIVDGELEQISSGHMFTEGPAWSVAGGFLLFSDIPANTIFKWQEGGAATSYIQPSGNSNGLEYDGAGKLFAARHGSRSVVQLEPAEAVVADVFDGKKLNSPNDLIIRSDGTIYFTDPPYGINPNQQEQEHQGLYRVDPGGVIWLLASDFDRPNGVALSPDESKLYVADTAGEHVRVFAVDPNGDAHGGEVFIDLKSDLPGDPDGMAVDEFGDLYVSGGGGVRVVTPDGALLGTIEVPEVVTNCAFGDADGKALFLTAQSKVYRIRLKVKGM